MWRTPHDSTGHHCRRDSHNARARGPPREQLEDMTIVTFEEQFGAKAIQPCRKSEDTTCWPKIMSTRRSTNSRQRLRNSHITSVFDRCNATPNSWFSRKSSLLAFSNASSFEGSMYESQSFRGGRLDTLRLRTSKQYTNWHISLYAWNA